MALKATFTPSAAGSSAGCDDWAATVLAPTEITRWEALPRYRHRREQWLLGRLAAKGVVQEIVRRDTGEHVPITEIVIGADANGAPRVSFARRLSDAVLPVVSISHTGSSRSLGVALGSADPAVLGVGIDVEEHRPRRALERKGLTDAERELLVGLGASAGPESLLRMWTAKEAAIKSLGVNLDQVGGPRAVTVTPMRSDGSEMSVEVPRSHRSMHTSRLTAYTSRDDGLVLAMAFALDPNREPVLMNLGVEV